MKTITIKLSQKLKLPNGKPVFEAIDGKINELTMSEVMINLISGLTGLSNSDAIRAWNLCSEIIKEPDTYPFDSDKLNFIIECFEKTQNTVSTKVPILKILYKAKEDLEKEK